MRSSCMRGHRDGVSALRKLYGDADQGAFPGGGDVGEEHAGEGGDAGQDRSVS